MSSEFVNQSGNTKGNDEEKNVAVSSNAQATGKKEHFNKPLAYGVALLVCVVAYFFLFFLILLFEAYVFKMDGGLYVGVKFLLLAYALRYVWKRVVSRFKNN